MKKEAKGDISPNYASNPTDVSPGGSIDYKVTITNLDPQRWYDPVVVDMLPKTLSRTFCTNTLAASNFNVKLRNALSLSDINLSNAPNVTVSLSDIDYGDDGSFPSDPAFCGGTQSLSGSYSTINNRALRIQFSGYLDCNDFIVISIPAEVMSTSATGTAKNTIFKTEKINPGGGYGVVVADNVDAQIVNWEPNCCDPAITWASFLQVGHRIDAGTHELIRGDFSLQSPSPIPIQRIRASIIDFSYDQGLQDCYKCKNNFKHLGTYPWWGAPDIANLKNVQNSPYPYVHHRERIWEGTPSDLSGGVTYPIYFEIPKPLNIPCCQGCVTICVKFEFTDVNCNTCEEVVCFSVKQGQIMTQPEPTLCPQNSLQVNPGLPYPSNDVGDPGIGIGNTTPSGSSLIPCVNCPKN